MKVINNCCFKHDDKSYVVCFGHWKYKEKKHELKEVMDTLNEYSRSIGFATGKSSFKEKTENILNAMTAIFKEYPKANFIIEGHTDSTGSEGFNQKLSEKRANAVHDYLVANGISDDRLSTVGYGETRPIDDNKTRAGRSNNRRVDVILND